MFNFLFLSFSFSITFFISALSLITPQTIILV
uniref:Uncharacterized protein n=1 Tax=Rhizophora mucronata TaxID=61149 RepID=A0A2P2QU10_RHIMU